MEDLQQLRAFQTWAGILGNDYIVGLGMKLFAALLEVQNEIGVFRSVLAIPQFGE